MTLFAVTFDSTCSYNVSAALFAVTFDSTCSYNVFLTLFAGVLEPVSRNRGLNCLTIEKREEAEPYGYPSCGRDYNVTRTWYWVTL